MNIRSLAPRLTLPINRLLIKMRLRRMMKARLKRERKRRNRYLRLRKKLTDNPRMRSVADYARDARRDRVLLRFAGRNRPGARAALSNRDILRRRYKRTMEFAGKSIGKWPILFSLAFLVGGVGTGIAGYLLTGHMDPTGARGFNPWFTGLAASGLGGGIGMGRSPTGFTCVVCGLQILRPGACRGACDREASHGF